MIIVGCRNLMKPEDFSKYISLIHCQSETGVIVLPAQFELLDDFPDDEPIVAIYKGENCMPKYCKITVCYLDGKEEEFYGGLHATKTVLRIWPQNGPAVAIPLVNIRKYETSEQEDNNG